MSNNYFPWKNFKLKKFITSDSAVLHYYHYKATSKKGTIVISLAWNMSPDVFSPLLLTNTKIRKYYDVYIVVIRGYIEQITYSNNIERCSIDLHEFIKYKNIKEIIILGHSIGVALWWAYIKNFGSNNIQKFILIDEMTRLLENPVDSKKTNLNFGSIIPTCEIYNAYNILIKGNDESNIYRKNIILEQFSPEFKNKYSNIMDKILEKVQLYTYTSTAEILLSNIPNNWIDLILNKLINIPTYLFGGINSIVPYQSIKYQKKFYTNSQIYIFSGDNSSHFAFMENYTLFNELINKFI